MNRALTTYLLISFLGVAVLGFLGTAFMNVHHMSCIASTSQGAVCPESADPLAFINFHFNALKGFSTAVFSSYFLFAISALFLILLLVFSTPRLAEKTAETAISRCFGSAPGDPRPPLIRRLSRWLAFHENSPAFALR